MDHTGDEEMKLEDVKQIEDSLFSYVSKIDVGGIPWALEYMENDTQTTLLFKRQGYGKEIKEFIDGGYQAVFPFEIYVQASRKDTKARLNLSRILEAVWQAMLKEMENGFPTLQLEGLEPVKFERTTLPSDFTGEKAKLSVFYCAFTLTYEKAGDPLDFLN